MSAKTDYIENQKKDCRERWFKNHKAGFVITPEASFSSNFGTAIINWQEPGTWTYGCRFIIHKRWLCVVGDIGEAVYEWSEDLNLKWLGGMDFHYFISKIQASEDGRHFFYFDKETAKKNIAEIRKQLEEEDKSRTYDKQIEVLNDLENESITNTEAGQEIYDATGDGELASMFSEIGQVYHPRTIGHFVGLQMAIAQLKAAA